MKKIFIISLLFVYIGTSAQAYYSKTYLVTEDSTGLTNLWPNYLKAVFPTDSLIYAFGYSADTSYVHIYGTSFYVFDLKGNLIDYYHIKDSDKYVYFDPEGIHTWDGIIFYTAFNSYNRQESILKFNRITREQEVFEIKNSVIFGGSIVFSNFLGNSEGFLITASRIAVENGGRKIQVTKMDTCGVIQWQTILGKEPGNGFENSCYAAYSDKAGNIYLGIGYTDNLGLGWKADYQNLFYKLDPLGQLVNSNFSKFGKTGFCLMYDIVQDDKSWFYVSADYNFNEPQYPYGNNGYGIILVFDSNMHFVRYKSLDFLTPYAGDAYTKSFEKILLSNDGNGLLLGGTIIQLDTTVSWNDTLMVLDTIILYRDAVSLVKVDDKLNFLWKRQYRIREGNDEGYLYDLKASPDGGYIIAAASYVGDAYEKNGEAYWMPWLLKVDDEGCLIPGCNVVQTYNVEDDSGFMLYPNPAGDYIVIQHTGVEKLSYSILSPEGKIIDQFSSAFEDEQIIVPLKNFYPGTYFVQCTDRQGNFKSKTFIKH